MKGVRSVNYINIKKSYFVEPHEEANLITEAFGIDSGYVQEICNIDIPTEFEVMYITGDSGSGKSTILREIVPNYKSETIPYEKPLFEWCGDSEEDKNRAISMLTLVGISDATMFVNYYHNLSDSQQARARIMLEMKSDKDIIVVDEFLSTLDRKTAKSVSYCIQKAVRKLNKKAIFCTAHDDLKEYLKADVVVEGKSFPSRFSVSKPKYSAENPILSETNFFYGDKGVYKDLRLAELHYKGKYTGGTKEYLFAELDGEIIACLVSTYRMFDGGRRISRVVVHPSYRGTGIGVAIVQKYINDFPGADVVASMALYNPVFEKAGMLRCDDSIVKSPSGMKKKLKEHGFDTSKWHSKRYCKEYCASPCNRKVVAFYSKNATHLVCPGGKYLEASEIKRYIEEDETTASRVLWGLRDRRMAKYQAK